MYAVFILAAAIGADPLHVAEPVFDAGEVRTGPPLVRRFEFRNNSDKPLTITEVRSSCGCMTPQLAKRDYQPGESGSLTVEVNTLSQPIGSHRWVFPIVYRCGELVGERTLELTAQLKQEIEITPAALAFRGDGPLSSTVTIRDRRPNPRITSLSPSGMTTSTPHLSTRRESTDCAFEVCVSADCPEGRHAETITITTDDPDYPTIKIPVTIFREPKQRVSASPARATLVAGGSALVQLRAADGSAVQVESIEGNSPILNCRWAAGPGDRATIRIALDRSKWDGKPLTSEVRLRLSAPAGESVIIPVSIRADD